MSFKGLIFANSIQWLNVLMPRGHPVAILAKKTKLLWKTVVTAENYDMLWHTHTPEKDYLSSCSGYKYFLKCLRALLGDLKIYPGYRV